jgi:Pyruvate/2-oxoacid:ferredoxin oxidoreductase delta subunit
MFNFINNYNFISVTGCVGLGPCALLCSVAYNAVKMVLSRNVGIVVFVIAL